MTHSARHPKLTLLALLALLALTWAAPRPGPAQTHVPDEQDLDRELAGDPDPDHRDFQKRSVRSFGHKVNDTSSWVKRHLGGMKVTWARVLLALGLVGLLLSWGKNKRITKWALLFAGGMLATAAGLAGVVLGL